MNCSLFPALLELFSMNENNIETRVEPDEALCPCCSAPLHISNASAELAPLGNYTHSFSKGTASTAFKEALSADPIKIMLVDDHQSFMDGLQMVVDTQKPRMEIVGTAATPDEAIEMAEELKPDVILLDLDLGDASGLDILPVLLEKTAAKILIVTGVCDSKIHDATIMKGARGVIMKREAAKEIVSAIERVYAGGVWIDSNILSRMMVQNLAQKAVPNEAEMRRINSLTPREREVVKALLKCENSTSDEIAGHLSISKHTLKNNLTAIYNKLEVKNRVQLMIFAINHKSELKTLGL